MRESRTYGFVRGAHSDMRPYRDLYLPQSFWTGLAQKVRLRSCDQHRIARAFRIDGVFSSETGKEGNAWNVVVY
jgi:hypothetical protein